MLMMQQGYYEGTNIGTKYKQMTYNINTEQQTNLVGHPFAPIGMGEHLRCTYRALRTAALRPVITDIYKLVSPDPEDFEEFSGVCKNECTSINIFHINGNEVEQAMSHLSYNKPWEGYNIIYPAWELARYPKEWADQLDRFDEIWAPSEFIKNSIEVVCKKPVIHMPLACDVVLTSFLSRRYFGIPESEYVFLFFFDTRSFVSRKNPFAVIQCFKLLLKERPYSNVRLVIKINGADIAPNVVEEVKNQIFDVSDNVTLICFQMTDNETKNLVRCSDCFLSLHRSEGFGRGISEAMVLGKPVITTGYSGNMDYVTEDFAFPVPYRLIPVLEDEYPFWQNQVWADPDVHAATQMMVRLIDNPEMGRSIGNKARLHMQRKFSYSSIGLRYRNRIEEIYSKII